MEILSLSDFLFLCHHCICLEICGVDGWMRCDVLSKRILTLSITYSPFLRQSFPLLIITLLPMGSS